MVSLWQLFAVLVIGIIMVLVTVLIVILIETRFGPKFIARSWSRLKTVFCSQDADQLLKYAVAYNGVLLLAILYPRGEAPADLIGLLGPALQMSVIAALALLFYAEIAQRR
ncbi:MAG: hypothetical protein IPJ68_04385 [Candidatus Moraniibacteriota bacterium]|nr:MAG: hypothetical protein IPJ68_04385 [Candidatus Moranbacteria bacterium]